MVNPGLAQFDNALGAKVTVNALSSFSPVSHGMNYQVGSAHGTAASEDVRKVGHLVLIGHDAAPCIGRDLV
jgi:hypothetical protein